MADSFRFNTKPPQEVTAYLADKALVPSFNYQDVWGAEHAHAFTVAKAMQLDVLTTLHDSVKKAQANGIPFEQFQKELTPKLQELGWWGTQEVIDPKSGEIILGRLGSPRRLKTIYESNMRTARAAGQWQRAQRTKRGLPFFLYGIGNSENHRPEHVAQNDVILPIDHPHWNYWFAPNGWGCKCWIRQISNYEANLMGGQSQEPEYNFKTHTNKRTGEVIKIPDGIDAGWHTNPGKTRFGTLRGNLNQSLNETSEAMRRAAIASSPLEDFAQSALSGEIKGKLSIPFASIDDTLGEALKTKHRSAFLSVDTITSHDNRSGIVAADYARLPQKLIDDGEVWRDKKGRMGAIHLINGAYWLMGMKTSESGEIFITTLHRWRERSIRKFKKESERLK